MRPRRGQCPDDLVVDILLRLPVKSLSRFKSVCKDWLTVIRSPHFIRNHFRRNSNGTGLLVYCGGEGVVHRPEVDHCHTFDSDKHNVVNAFTLFPDKTLELRELAYHKDLTGSILEMHGPCNGVFCLLRVDYRLALWNPSTRKLRLVPPPPHMGFDFLVLVHDFGFGMDPSTDDLKIVLFDGDLSQPGFTVYSSNDDSWRSFEEKSLVDPLTRLTNTWFTPTFCNGFYYWVKYKYMTRRHVILAFDMHNEVFQEIETPEIILESSVEQKLVAMHTNYEVGGPEFPDIVRILSSHVERQLHWYGDSLALSTHFCFTDETRFDIWLMKEQGCWTKILTLSLPFKIHTASLVSNQIFAVTPDLEVMIYDIASRTTRNIEFGRIKYASGDYIIPFPYQESLVSV